MAKHAEDGSADKDPGLAAEIDIDRVGGAGPVTTEILELPAPLDRLQVALLLGPAQPGRSVIGEAHLRLDRAHLRVGLGLAEDRAAFAVALECVHRLEAALPLG